MRGDSRKKTVSTLRAHRSLPAFCTFTILLMVGAFGHIYTPSTLKGLNFNNFFNSSDKNFLVSRF